MRYTNIITESSIEDSYIYKTFNASNSLVEKLVKYIKTASVLDSSFFEEQYFQMKRTSITPLTNKVIEAFENGLIEILYSRDAKIGTSIPFIIRKNSSGKIVASIFISSFSVLDKNNVLPIPVKQLYGLMESAYVGLMIQTKSMIIQRNTEMMRLASNIYSEMFMRILNKDYALSLDRELYDKVLYAVSRFFLERIWGYPNATLIDSYASTGLKYITDLDLSLIRTNYTDSDIKDINDLIKFLSTISPRMKELNTRYFIERYINTYHGASIMSIDYLPYLFFVIINVLIGTFLVSQTALNDVIKNIRGINKFYIEMSKLFG